MVITPTGPEANPSDRPLCGVIAAILGIVLATAAIESALGRSVLGPDGRFGVWEGDIWSRENSQRLADPYSFSHLGHGILFFALLWWVARRLPLDRRLLVAVAMEAVWEILENSPVIINRYREATIAAGYDGDSVLNSTADVAMMGAGFLFASRARPWQSVAALLVMEIGCGLCVRDNLTLNVVMLIHPFDAIKAWQTAGRPDG